MARKKKSQLDASQYNVRCNFTDFPIALYRKKRTAGRAMKKKNLNVRG